MLELPDLGQGQVGLPLWGHLNVKNKIPPHRSRYVATHIVNNLEQAKPL